ncbi:type I restriction enzyme HsdR N-terminal domain-containing protein [bacterium BMS3Abin03]|nr:type I restriction enzyme HsdR N-terminal domain-containing protein [bacterium BMS3Abin03]
MEENMIDNITKLIDFIKTDKKVKDFDEITTKQTIVLHLLSILGWDIFSAVEVCPEYQVESRRVDYSLRLKNRDYVFIEVKKPKEDLESHQEQLLDYAFRLGVEIAILTNGLTWWFYLPTIQGNWNSRKFFTIDAIEQDSKASSEKFVEFLSKVNIHSGEAIKSAEKIHKSRVRKSTIDSTLPEAWNKIISEPDSLLIEMISDVTEKICGYRPEESDVKSFVKGKQDRILLDTFEDINIQKIIEKTRRKSSRNIKPKNFNRSSGTIKILINAKRFEAPSIPKLYIKVLRLVVDNGSINKLRFPWGFGSKRYFAFKGKNPIHPSGRAFFSPITYGEYHLETHVNRISGIKYLQEFCEELGYKFELIDV